MRVSLGAVAALCLLATATATAQTSRQPAPSQPVVGGAPSGRFQIVNGSPEFRGSTMLLDTVTVTHG